MIACFSSLPVQADDGYLAGLSVKGGQENRVPGNHRRGMPGWNRDAPEFILAWAKFSRDSRSGGDAAAVGAAELGPVGSHRVTGERRGDQQGHACGEQSVHEVQALKTRTGRWAELFPS